MKKKTIILPADSFNYPTANERKEMKDNFLKIERLDIKYESAFFSILDDNPFELAIRKEDIYWWNNCLNNRIGKLSETLIYASTHFERLQKGVLVKDTEEILFDYYSEIFYYYYFSTRDVLAQLLNLIFDLGLNPNKIYFNENFINNISDNEIQEYLRTFLSNTRDSYDIRNAFNHRFTPNQKDNRASTNIIKTDDTISVFTPKERSNNEIYDEIKHLQRSLSKLMNDLSTKFG